MGTYAKSENGTVSKGNLQSEQSKEAELNWSRQAVASYLGYIGKCFIPFNIFTIQLWFSIVTGPQKIFVGAPNPKLASKSVYIWSENKFL